MSIRGVSKIVVHVGDQQRARDFWVGLLGFEAVVDEAYDESGAQRWIEVESPDGLTRLILDPQPEQHHPDADLPTAPFFFYADDIRRTYTELSAAGVDFPQPPVRMAWGWWCLFRDTEGNRYALQER